MNRLVLSGIALGLLASPTMAADMAVKAPIMKAPPMPIYSWTGCYLNAGVGYGMWNQDHSVTTDFTNGNVDTPNIQTIEVTDGGRGWLGRFGGGCDLQLSGTTFSNFVIGVFGDYDAADLTGSLVPQLFGNSGTVLSGNEKESSAWAVGGRIGYVLAPQIMTYVDAGWTQIRFDQINLTGSLGDADGTAFPAHTYNGWFLGSGFEYNFTWLPIQGLFLRTEYRFASTNRDDLTEFFTATGAPAGNAGLGSVLHSKKEVQTVTSSLVWRFNWFH